ncbi:hypothetical protein [Orenia metallireducens]|uniref:hypothetical protein n=1 Tax=Orenia metallireducens TaxID=1413210 RepID=UPI00159F0017|nr:hypothetical protein [Orenia metallireducens]
MFSKEGLADFLEVIKFFLSFHTPFGNRNTISMELDEMYVDLNRLIKVIYLIKGF